MKKTDVIIIGAGLLGCFTARALSKTTFNTLVFEKNNDVSTGISKANSAIVYAGIHTTPDTLKAELCVKGCIEFDELCKELDVPFKRCGSIMVCYGKIAEKKMLERYEQGIKNGVRGLKILTKEEILSLEPSLSGNITAGLLVPDTGTVNPWELCIAAYENAKDNGINFCFNEEVLSIERIDTGFIVKTNKETYLTRAIANCAGLYADSIHSLVEDTPVKIEKNGADYVVFDTSAAPFPSHIVFQEKDNGKGITLIPTVDGNILAGPTERPSYEKEDYSTTEDGLKEIHSLLNELIPSLSTDKIIRSYGATRPNPYFADKKDKSIYGFTVIASDGLFSLIGIKTPGLTCSKGLGEVMADHICDFLGNTEKNTSYSPVRKGIVHVNKMDIKARNELIKKDPAYGEIVCKCRQITKGEITEAIRRGATTPEGVKRRIGTSMGRCQGSRCTQKIADIISEVINEKI
ncbi:MAG: NAD(P)/FAD-dependent oxidoreductase [Lachnospiraceae bacterium]|nr:NAD(P)/FAD-dependent oxidoreductase [Lachnospiraceae bacterium]